MKGIPKRIISLGMAFCMASLLAVSGDYEVVKAEEPAQFNMSQSGTTGEEDWSKLRIDMEGLRPTQIPDIWVSLLQTAVFGQAERRSTGGCVSSEPLNILVRRSGIQRLLI